MFLARRFGKEIAAPFFADLYHVIVYSVTQVKHILYLVYEAQRTRVGSTNVRRAAFGGSPLFLGVTLGVLYLILYFNVTDLFVLNR